MGRIVSARCCLYSIATGLGVVAMIGAAAAVSMDRDRRAGPAEYAKRAGIGPHGYRERYGATGLVRCGTAIGTAQLTLRADLITTAAHVLIGSDGRPHTGACTFEPVMGTQVAIDTGSIRTGSRKPLAEPATRDWAVARLARPVVGARPYGLAASWTLPSAVVMCGGGHKVAASIGTEHCAARKVVKVAADGIRELAFDCNAGPGTSGAALLRDGRNVAAIYVGYRSSDPARPQAFSDTHYNFAITVEGPFRRALLAAARQH
jgi:hypothetical protein